MFETEIFKSIYNKFKSCCICFYIAVTFWHSFLPVFAWRRVVLHFFDKNNCCEFLAFYGVITESVVQLSKERIYVVEVLAFESMYSELCNTSENEIIFSGIKAVILVFLLFKVLKQKYTIYRPIFFAYTYNSECTLMHEI